ncbi:acyl-CoA N-acyltransferase [Talaromyces proteolyticus]|uniref:Acyl-CoA N-acyltransferase n=1 Tax=Talaromyces proteolyticus TaxID=1131652 RepID=A0AAD4KSL5_9EURO|nr:acyl-CoA N-acyltransferase [Talaromyces proteolyticus]KAH8697843.1 acyl-CoA N-acyltransferase [Talaromyces proteolyticus]
MVGNTGDRDQKRFTLKLISDPSYAVQLAVAKHCAFKDNPLNKTMYPMDDENVSLPWLAERERRAIMEGKSTITVIIDNDDSGADGEKIAAYARWKIPAKFRPENPDYKQRDDEDKQEGGISVGAGSTAALTVAEELDGRKYIEPPLPAGSNVPLVTEFRAALNMLRKTYWNEETEYLLGSLSTDPSYQGQGCGSLLLDWGVRHADANGAAIYLESTPVAQKLYKKFGWKAVDRMELDLGKYGGPNLMHGLTAMRREARSTSSS